MWYRFKLVFARLGRDQTILVSLVIAYLVTGKLGLMLAFTNPATSLVWPPSGIALAAYLVLGYRVWPAILLASGLLYAAVIGPELPVLFMAAGNTGEGLLAAYRLFVAANRPEDAELALQSALRSARFQLRTQIGPEAAMFLPNPQRALGGFAYNLNTLDVRIDYVQHNVSALLALLNAWPPHLVKVD